MSQVAITLRDFITDNQDIIGSGPDDACSIGLVNKARVIAYTVEDCVGTIGYCIVPTVSGTFFLDSRFEAIRQVRRCGSYKNSGVLVDIDSSEYCSCAGDALVVRIHGRSYCPVQLTENCGLCFACLNMQDDGTVMTIHYTDTKGTERREQLTVRHFSNGMSTLQYEAASISKIHKPVTKGRIVVQTNSQEGFIEPFEQIPSYSIYNISGYASYVAVKAKKRCIPFTLDSIDSILDINPEALSSLIIAIKARSERGPTWVQDYSSAFRLGRDFLKAEVTNEEDTSHGMSSVNMDNAFFDDIVSTADMIAGDSFYVR